MVGTVEIFELRDDVKQLMPEHANSFQEWVDSLSSNEFADYLKICTKQEATELEDSQLLSMALSIFFKESDISSMPLVEELLIQLLGEFKKGIIKKSFIYLKLLFDLARFR